MARASRRPGAQSNPRGSAVRGASGATPSPRGSNPRGAPPSARNLLEDCAGIDEMGGRSRPVSRRLNLQTDDLTDETGLEVGRQRNVPKTIANASLPKLNFDDLDRGLPKLPGDSGQRAAPQRPPASHSAALEGIDTEGTQSAGRRPNPALDADLEMPETLPVGPPPADSGIMRVRMNASAVLSAVDYNDNMKGTTVEEARRRDSGSKPPDAGKRRGRRGRKSRRNSGAAKPARQQGTSTMAKASTRTGSSPSHRAAPEPRPSGRTSNRASRRATAEGSTRASRRSKASRSANGGGNSTMIMGIVGGVALLLIVIGIVAFATSNGSKGAPKSTPGIHHSEDSPQYWEAKGEELVRTGGDRNLAKDYLLRAVELYDAQGDKARADELAKKAYGLHKDGVVDVRGR